MKPTYNASRFRKAVKHQPPPITPGGNGNLTFSFFSMMIPVDNPLQGNKIIAKVSAMAWTPLQILTEIK